jgi:hypothetical protein
MYKVKKILGNVYLKMDENKVNTTITLREEYRISSFVQRSDCADGI